MASNGSLDDADVGLHLGGLDSTAVGRGRSLLQLLEMTWASGKGYSLAILVLVVVSGVAPVAVTAATGRIADAIAAGRRSEIAFPGVVLAVSLVTAGSLTPISRYFARSFARLARRAALDNVFAAVSSYPTLEHYERPSFYDRISLALGAAMTGPNVILSAGSASIAQGITLVGFVVIVTRVDVLYGGLLMVAMAPSLAAEVIIGRRRAQIAAQTSPLERRRAFFTSLMLDRRAAAGGSPLRSRSFLA